MGNILYPGARKVVAIAIHVTEVPAPIKEYAAAFAWIDGIRLAVIRKNIPPKNPPYK